MKSTTGTKVTAAFGLALGFLLILAWFGYSTPRRFIEFTQRRQESVQILEHLALFVSHVKDAETGQRGFLLTGNAAYLEPYDSSKAGIQREQEELARSIAGHAEYEPHFARLQELVRRKLAELQQTIDIRKGDPEHGLAEALKIVDSGSGKQIMDGIRATATQIQDKENAVRDHWIGESDASARRLLVATALVSPVAIVLVAASAWLILRDLAARTRAEDAVRRLNDELEQRVEERTAELVEVNRALTQKNQEVETFVYSVSHDLRSPLVNLQGFSQELSTVGKDLHALLESAGLPEEIRTRGFSLLEGDMAESIRFIQSAVMRLSNIIDALLRLSRAGRVVYQWQFVDLNAAVSRIVEAQAAVIARKAASIEVGDLPPVWGDPTAVEQVFANLIGNALNYLDPQRAGIVKVGSVPAGLAALALAGTHTIFVADNGLGIAKDVQGRVFHAFQRMHPGASPGEGIGLTLVFRTVERHGGRIWFESAAGAGTTFFVALPSRAPFDRNSQNSVTLQEAVA
ncbi:MAG TPA: CHASE3 domain-containing protein [Planctomycetaceae bacterium]|nr:CHASE3 domain-containing protein [Planctomycetaceae bacterium]